MRRLDPHRRRLLVQAGLIVLFVIALVIAPGYAASRPGFAERYPAFRSAHGAWQESVHAKVACSSCHVPPTIAERTAYHVRMVGEFYLTMIAPDRDPELFERPSNAACASCHFDLRTVSPSGDVKIPHRAHVTVLEIDCVTCHDFLVHEKNPTGTNIPTMAGCMTCHDGVTAKDDCSACHTDKDRPTTHDAANWEFEHPAAVDESCNSCHDWTERWCADCHAKRPASHSENWRADHRHRVTERRNCEACHEPAFCIRCHGEHPQRNLDPALKLVE